MTAYSDFKFIHLNCHTSYSLLEAIPSIKGLTAAAKGDGMPAFAVTDTHNMFNMVEMSMKVPGEGVQPILGTQLGVEFEKSAQMGEGVIVDNLHVLVQNEKGYHNCIELNSQAFIKTPDGITPNVPVDDLIAKSEGLIIMTGGARDGFVGRMVRQGKKELAKQMLQRLADAMPGRVYVEIQRHGMPEELQSEKDILDLAYELNLPLVATNDVRFLTKAEFEAHNVMLCIGDGNTLDAKDRRQFTEEHYFKSQEQMCELFADLPEACENTVNIAKRCSFIAPTGIYYMPAWLKSEEEEASGMSVDDILRQQSYDGLKERMEMYVFTDKMTDAEKAKLTEEYNERLEYELGIIIRMGYSGYFLITSDFIKWAKENDIPVGPGRGSGAGSLVAWAVKVTDVDPIPWDLYFERFLNPERVSLPDFDVDFCQERRLEVVDYVRRKYGDGAVSQIITFGTLKAKACIRDVGRVLQMSFGHVGKIAAFVPEGPPSVPIKQALADDERFQQMYDDDEDVKQLIDIAMQLEGCYRHASTHAAGVIIADRQITEVCPLYRDPRSDMPATQLSMVDAETVGLVKFDFLGLKTLTTVKYAVDFVKENHGIELDPLAFPLDDEKTLKMLQEGHTIGVFQVESQGMTDFLKRIYPDKFQYLSDIVALYRPGPLASGMADDFIECRHGRQEPKYPHPTLIPVLEETFGVPVYQEQVMRMAQVLAGYTLGGADMLRRAMGKKKPAEMDKQRKIFVAGAKEHNDIPEDEANQIFDLMANFSGYGFNKAHTIAYGIVAWQTAWLKAHYPLEFMAASMTMDRGNVEKVFKFKRELDRMKVQLLPPDVNFSKPKFVVEDNKAVRFAFTAIKGGGEEAAASITKEREENGAYKDIYDFVSRQTPKSLNKKQMEVLIKAGAFDNLEPNRAKLFTSMETLLNYMHTVHEEKNSAQIGLFGGGDTGESALAKPPLADVPDWDMFQRLEHEQAVIGFYLSGHPLDGYADELEDVDGLTYISSLYRHATEGKKEVKLAVICTGKREMKTKKGSRMAILTMSDATGQEEIAAFPETYNKFLDVLDSKEPLLLTINLGIDGERLRINVEEIALLDSIVKGGQTIRIIINHPDAIPHVKDFIKRQEKGMAKVEIDLPLEGIGTVSFNIPEHITLNKKATFQLSAIDHVEVAGDDATN